MSSENEQELGVGNRGYPRYGGLAKDERRSRYRVCFGCGGSDDRHRYALFRRIAGARVYNMVIPSLILYEKIARSRQMLPKIRGCRTHQS